MAELYEVGVYTQVANKWHFFSINDCILSAYKYLSSFNWSKRICVCVWCLFKQNISWHPENTMPCYFSKCHVRFKTVDTQTKHTTEFASIDSYVHETVSVEIKWWWGKCRRQRIYAYSLNGHISSHRYQQTSNLSLGHFLFFLRFAAFRITPHSIEMSVWE